VSTGVPQLMNAACMIENPIHAISLLAQNSIQAGAKFLHICYHSNQTKKKA
jgi:hypothetical protein